MPLIKVDLFDFRVNEETSAKPVAVERQALARRSDAARLAARVATPDLERRVHDAVAEQPFMSLLGVQVVHVAPGEVDLAFAFDERLTQQHGFLIAGVVAAVSTARAATRVSACEGETTC